MVLMQIRRLAWSLFTSGLIQVAGIITGLVSARILGPEGRGALAGIVSLIMATGAIAGLSIGDAVVYYAARKSSELEIRKTLTTGLSLAFLLATLGVCVAFAVTRPLVMREPSLSFSTSLFLVNIPLYLITNVLVGYSQSLIRTQLWSLMRAVPQLINAMLCLAAFLSRSHVGVEFFLEAQLIGNAVLLLTATGIFWANHIRLSSFDKSIAHELLSFGGRLHASAVGQNTRDHLDRIVMAMFLTPAALGYYASTATLASCLVIIGVSIDMAILPSLARASPEKMRAQAISVAKVAGVAIAIATAGLTVLAPIVIPFLFGRAFKPAASIAPYLCWAYGVAAFKVVLASAMKASNRPLRAGGVEVATVVIMLIVMPPLVYWLGPIGAGLSALAAQLLSGWILLRMFSDAFSSRWQDWFNWSTEIYYARAVVTRQAK